MAKYRYANCMGYALGQNKWLILDAWRRFIEADEERGPFDPEPEFDDDSLTRETVEELIVDEMESFGLRPVKRKDMRLGVEYVAVKFSLEDFHFMRRNIHGHWRHKPGGTEVRGIKEKDVFKSKWGGGILYNSRTLLFGA